MDKNFSIIDIEAYFPNAIVEENGEKAVDTEKLIMAMAEEICDLKDQLNEKDYQVTKIFERLERLAENA